MSKTFFGVLPTGENIYLYNISNGNVKAHIMTFGATLVNLEVFGINTVGGFDSLDAYLSDTSHQGGTIGRVANRIENARFTLDGKIYTLPKNNKENCLHGGVGFDRRVWIEKSYTENSLTLSYTSHDGEEGFPANLETEVTYSILDNSLMIEYTAKPDGKTPIALTNHSYFNLDGFGKDIKGHYAKIYADSYTEVNASLIPTGEHPNVSGTPFDFRERKQIGKDFSDSFTGYDHNFVTNAKTRKEFKGKKLGLIAEVDNRKILLSVYTDQPGVQFYTSNFLGKGPDFRGNIKPIKHGAFCLETQTEPNCVNHGEAIYCAGDVYTHNTVYKFEKINGDCLI